jgi:hypothetical protein
MSFLFEQGDLVQIKGGDATKWRILECYEPNPATGRNYNLYEIDQLKDPDVRTVKAEGDLIWAQYDGSIDTRSYITLREIAKATGLATATLRQYTSGRAKPHLPVAERTIVHGVTRTLILRSEYLKWKKLYQTKKPWGSNLHKKRVEGKKKK